MRDTTPAHVSDVEESVHALKIDESTEIGDILDLTFDLITNSDGAEEFLTEFGPLGFDHFTAAENEVLAVVVDLDDFKFVNVTNIFLKVAWWDNIHL